MNTQILFQAVRQIQASDKRWIPEDLQGIQFFGAYDIWEYFGLGDVKSECVHCLRYDGKMFSGQQLRSVFPDLIILGEDDIYPNVHMTLWGAETCKCQLIRVNKELIKPEQIMVYAGE